MTEGFKVNNFVFLQQSECFELIYTVSPSNASSKTYWSFFPKKYMFKSFVNCMKIKCETNSFESGIVIVFCSCHYQLYRYSIMAVSICIGWCLYPYCTDTDCIVPALECSRFLSITSECIVLSNMHQVSRQKAIS